MPGLTSPLERRLAGVAAASGLAMAGLVLAAAPASAAACSGTSGVTVVVDTGGSITTRCAVGDPRSAWGALEAAGFKATLVAPFPGAICQINGFPATSCQQMPPANAYWAFFHAKRGGSWAYSSSGAGSYDPAPGTAVGFRFGSGQQPRVAPPAAPLSAPPATSKPAPAPARPRATSPTPKKTPATPVASSATARSGTPATSASRPKATARAGTTTARPSPSARPSAAAVPKGSASASATATASARATASASPSPTTDGEPTTLAAAPAAQPVESSGPLTLLAGGALVVLVAGGAGFVAWKRRG